MLFFLGVCFFFFFSSDIFIHLHFLAAVLIQNSLWHRQDCARDLEWKGSPLLGVSLSLRQRMRRLSTFPKADAFCSDSDSHWPVACGAERQRERGIANCNCKRGGIGP